MKLNKYLYKVDYIDEFNDYKIATESGIMFADSISNFMEQIIAWYGEDEIERLEFDIYEDAPIVGEYDKLKKLVEVI